MPDHTDAAGGTEAMGRVSRALRHIDEIGLRRSPTLIAAALICCVVGLLFLASAPSNGDFYWPDSPRHALNGAFLLDFAKAMPFGDPRGYAFDYYSRYPALTIGAYPPLLSIELAAFYALFGVSHATALFALFVHYCALCIAAFLVLRRLCGSLTAGLLTVVFAALPEVTLWGRQVMLEIPAFSYLAWSAWAFLRHIDEKRPGYLYLSAALLLLAMYTKISVAFVAIAYAVALIHARGPALFRDRHFYLVVVLSMLGVAPLIGLTLMMGQVNVVSAMGIADAEVQRWSIAGWLWYANRIADQIGVPAMLALVASLLLLLTRARDRFATDHWLWLGWFVAGYIFFSLIDLKEARHSVFLLLPIVVVIAMAADLLSRHRAGLGAAAAAVLAGATLVSAIAYHPVPHFSGYNRAVAYVAAHAPPNSNVVFFGYQDGTFIYQMRAIGGRPDIGVIRADKLLLRLAVRRTLGVTEKKVSMDEINATLDRLRVFYVVAQPDFWTDLQQMDRFQKLLQGPDFPVVATIPLTATYPGQATSLVIHRNATGVAAQAGEIVNELPVIEQVIKGSAKMDSGGD